MLGRGLEASMRVAALEKRNKAEMSECISENILMGSQWLIIDLLSMEALLYSIPATRRRSTSIIDRLVRL